MSRDKAVINSSVSPCSEMDPKKLVSVIHLDLYDYVWSIQSLFIIVILCTHDVIFSLKMRRSPVFLAMFTAPLEEASTGILKIFDVNYKTANAALHYVYTSEIRKDYPIEVWLVFSTRLISLQKKKNCDRFIVE